MFKRQKSKNWHINVRLKGKVKEISLGTHNKNLARKIETRIKSQLIEEKYLGKTLERSFDELAEKYLRVCTPKKSPRSRDRDDGIFRRRFLPFFGGKSLSAITAADVSAYKAERLKSGISPDTANKELSLLKAAFNVAIREWDWVNVNPVMKVKMERATQGRIRHLTAEEMTRLQAACEPWLLSMVQTARYTGMRRGNLLELRWGDIDMGKRLITLERTKNGERVVIPICAPLCDVLTGLKKSGTPKSDCVFGGVHPMKLRRGFLMALKTTGIKNFRWHDLRHQFASELVQAGVPLLHVKELLGHKDLRMTLRYGHLAPEHLREAVRAFERGYKPRRPGKDVVSG